LRQIIPKNRVSVESNWQKELALSFTDPEKLLEYLNLPVAFYQQDIKARRLFPMRVPRHFADLMQPGDRDDPLLQQVFPNYSEFSAVAGFTADPLLEQSNQTPGLLHKYKSRALLIVRGGCAVNCRYCFRRHFPYADNALSRHQWQQALATLASAPEINEIILSGGDPLMAKDQALADLAQLIEAIPQVKRLRIHTRLPVVIPQRINTEFLNWISAINLQKVMVLHINHANEVSTALAAKVNLLKENGITVLNQAVLLKGINDSVEAQVGLSEALFEVGVLPYYLHLLDKVDGAAHFNVEQQTAINIMRGVIAELPGFLVPRLVREIGGESAKSPIDLGLDTK
jgi:EF-P beta-lysylation protein EpmB